MIIVDTALGKRLAAGNPVRVALVAAGYMGRGIALQIISANPGMRLAAIANRTVGQAERAYREAGVNEIRAVPSAAQLEKAMTDGAFAVTDDPTVVCRARGIEAVIETSGDVEFGARVALEAVKNGKHVILMNAEVDAAVGPILKVHADRSGAVYTYTDGDEPGVAMNLYRFVDSIGYKPVMMGQIKGFLNRYRNPDTQREFAEKHRQKAAMVASFADGSKLALESAIMGNATGFKPAKLGMHGHECKHVKDLLQLFKPEDFRNGGIVDFVLGAEPHT
ncbi:MAG: NAD(P)-dependent oxidoreductase, partial [Planctomycetaceae bacterium]